MARATIGVGVSVAAASVIGFGSGVAGAAPVLGDDPVPVPAPAAADPAAGVNVANAFLQVFNSLLNRLVPGAGSIMPADASTLTPGGGYPSSTLPGSSTFTLPGQTALPGQPGTTTLGGQPGTNTTGSQLGTTTLGGQPGTNTTGGQAGTTTPGQAGVDLPAQGDSADLAAPSGSGVVE